MFTGICLSRKIGDYLVGEGNLPGQEGKLWKHNFLQMMEDNA